jgi:hypothetical protein
MCKQCILLLGFLHGLSGSSVCVIATDQTSQKMMRAVATLVDLSSAERRSSDRSNATENVCIEKVPDGQYSLEVTAPGFMTTMLYPVRVGSPARIDIPVRLIVGSPDPLRSTYVGSDAILFGTLKNRSTVADTAEICLFRTVAGTPVKCASSNEVGQYELVVRPDAYTVEITRLGKKIYSGTLDASRPGYYHNRLSISER